MFVLAYQCPSIRMVLRYRIEASLHVIDSSELPYASLSCLRMHLSVSCSGLS